MLAAQLPVADTGTFVWLAIALVISVEAWRLARSALGVLMETAPPDIDPEQVRAAMAEVDGVRRCMICTFGASPAKSGCFQPTWPSGVP